MKKYILLIAVILLVAVSQGYSQAKKPTIMVVPGMSWCSDNGYMKAFDNQGTQEKLPDYEAALLNTDLTLAITKIGELMSDRGFPLKDLASVMRSIRNDTAEESVTMSSDGDRLAETPLERITRVAKADILIEINFKINKVGPKYSLTYIMQGIDSYTNKQVAAASGTGDQVMSAEIPLLIEASVVQNMDAFCTRLDSHFTELFDIGREVTLVCRAWDNGDVNFETEFNGEELGFIIEDWLYENTVQGRFSTSDASENRMYFEQVRIPIDNEKGRAVDARTWANELRKMLQSSYGIDAKLSIKGLGQAIITVGGK